jgi:hypothetical protein
VPVVNGYITVEYLRDILRDQHTAYDWEYEAAINAASRQLDDYCGRVFYQDPTATPKLFRPHQVDLCWVPDISTTTGLIVETDDAQNGSFSTTWAAADYQMEPFERKNGKPYEMISAIGSKEFPVNGLNIQSYGTFRASRRALVRVTARWGWASVPSNIVSACIIQSVDNFKAKDLSHVASTYGNEVRVARDYSPGSFGRKVKFSRTRAPLLNPQAEALISSLRKTVIA